MNNGSITDWSEAGAPETELGGGLVSAETTAGMQRGRPFQPGHSGNPTGRPKGSKHKLTEALLSLIADDFVEHGAEAIAKVRQDDPATYLKIVGSLVPRGLILKREESLHFDYADLTEQEMFEIIDRRRKQKYVEGVINAFDRASLT